jgi:hypothetical protein
MHIQAYRAVFCFYFKENWNSLPRCTHHDEDVRAALDTLVKQLCIHEGKLKRGSHVANDSTDARSLATASVHL